MEVIKLAWGSIISPQFKAAGIFLGGEYEARYKDGQEEEDCLFHKFVRCQLEKAAVSKEKADLAFEFWPDSVFSRCRTKRLWPNNLKLNLPR